MDEKILVFVKKVRERQRVQSVLDALLVSLSAGLLCAVFISLLSLWIPLYYAIPVSVGFIVLSVIVGIVSGIKRTPSLEKSALIADARGHKEKLTTALELAGREDAFSILQKKDALKVIDGFRINKEFPLTISWKKSVAFVLLAIIFGVTAAWDAPAKRQAITKHEVKKESLEEIAKLEKVEKDISKADKLSEIEKADLDKQIEQAKQEMKLAESVEDIKKAEDRITKKMEMSAETLSDTSAKKTLEEAVEQNKADQAKRIEEAVKEAEEAMDKAATGGEKAKNDAYEKLNKLAETSGSDTLKNAAKEYKSSDYSNSDYIAANQALNNVKNDLKGSDMTYNSSGNPSGNSDKNSDDNGNSDNDSGRNSQGNSGQQGNQEQSGNNGSGNGNGEGQGNQGQSGNNGSGTGNGSGSGWNRGSKNGVEGKAKVNENVTIPDGTAGNDDDLTGKANGNDTSTKEKSSQSNTWSGNKISYGQVSGQYKEKAYKKVNGSNYPGKMKEKIRDYFDGLE